MPKTHEKITLDGELLQALDEFVASRPRNERALAMEAALAEKMSRLARMLLTHAGTRRPRSRTDPCYPPRPAAVLRASLPPPRRTHQPM